MNEQLAIDFAAPGSEERRQANQVLWLIRPRIGRSRAISMHAIEEKTGIPTRTVQAIVKFCVEELRFPIGTSPSKPYGYFWIETEEERIACRNHFFKRALSNLDHARAYDSSEIADELIGQLRIELGEEEP